MDSLYDVSPLLPTAVHVTHDNKVIVGAIDKGPYFPVTGPRQVIIMDHTGREKKFFQFDTFMIDITCSVSPTGLTFCN
jgi:hypothetical protein